MIDTGSDTWVAIKNELMRKRQRSLNRLLSANTGHSDSMYCRGYIHAIDHILSIPKKEMEEKKIESKDIYQMVTNDY